MNKYEKEMIHDTEGQKLLTIAQTAQMREEFKSMKSTS
jgi:hypothetical protein